MATPNPIQPIQPLNIPSAAGVNYGEGDVRHFAQGDDMSVPGISNPTRQLAERDNMLAEKLNEVIQNVNNQEQFVPLPIVRTVVPPSDQTVVLNYRIPAGFESRILNASISSNPTSADVELDIYYNTTFGGTTGTAVVTTSSEFSGGVNFYQTGEFIVTLKNKSGITLEMVASILLTLRPLGSEGTLLVGSVIKGDKGDPGQGGPPGPPGAPGSGGVGSPGMNWTGTWANNHLYAQRDVARYDLGYVSPGVGDQVSSFYCLQGHLSSDVIIPGEVITAYWEPVALGGVDGSTGPAGPPGPAGSTTFVGNETNVNATLVAGTPFKPDAYWDCDATPGNGGVYVATGLNSPGDSVTVPMKQVSWQASGAPSPSGVAYLSLNLHACFGGFGTLTLPNIAGGAKVNYSNLYIHAVVASNGTQDVSGAVAYGVVARPHPTDSTKIIMQTMDAVPGNPSPVPMIIEVSGMQLTP